MLQAVAAPPPPVLTAHLATLEALRQRAESIASAVDAYRAPIFARFAFTDREGQPIASPARVFLARDRAAVAEYYAELEAAHVAHRLPRRGPGACPATSAALDLRGAEGAAPAPPAAPVLALAAPTLPPVARSPRLAAIPAASGSFPVTVWDSELREGKGGSVVVQIETEGAVTEQERRAARRVSAAALASTYRHEQSAAVRAALREARQLARAGDPECVAAPLNAAVAAGLLPHELPAVTAELRRLYQTALRDRQEIAARVAALEHAIEIHSQEPAMSTTENCRDSNRWLHATDFADTVVEQEDGVTKTTLKTLRYVCAVCGAELVATATTGNAFFPYASPPHPAAEGAA